MKRIVVIILLALSLGIAVDKLVKTDYERRVCISMLKTYRKNMKRVANTLSSKTWQHNYLMTDATAVLPVELND